MFVNIGLEKSQSGEADYVDIFISNKISFYLFYLQRLQRGFGESAIGDTTQIVFNQRSV